MNKQDFLTELDKSLASLSKEEREDILRDMDEYFREALMRGRSEEDIAKQLGSPKTIAETIIAEAKVKRIHTANTVSQKISAVFSALIAILLLTPLNLIFVLLPLMLVTLFIMGSWLITGLITILLPVVCLLVLIMAIHVGFKIVALLALLFFALGWLGLTLALISGMTIVTILFFKAIAGWFSWNIKFIKNRIKG